MKRGSVRIVRIEGGEIVRDARGLGGLERAAGSSLSVRLVFYLLFYFWVLCAHTCSLDPDSDAHCQIEGDAEEVVDEPHFRRRWFGEHGCFELPAEALDAH